MKKIITLSIICLIGFGAQAQDKMVKRFNEIKAELDLNEEQDAIIKSLIKERKEALTKIKNESDFIESEEATKKRKIEKIKKRKEINKTFRSKLEVSLDENQLATLKKMMPAKEKKTLEEKESKPGSSHEHKDGENHSH